MPFYFHLTTALLVGRRGIQDSGSASRGAHESRLGAGVGRRKGPFVFPPQQADQIPITHRQGY
jgi:hypothetical protein